MTVKTSEQAPEFDLEVNSGERVKLSDYRELRRRVEDAVERVVGGGSFAGSLVALERERH